MKNQFETFDIFIISQMGYELQGTKEENEQLRKEAYHTFLHRMQGEKPASLPTIRRWFGIHGNMTPTREQIFRVAFALGLSLEKTEEYLTKGISQPGFQINDYMEIMAMYGLENHWTFEKYQSRRKEYEQNLAKEHEISHEGNTQWIMREFQHLKHEPEEQFMYWMWKHAKVFKGYSKTTQEYLNKYRQTVLEYMRRDVKKSLDLLLAETGYDNWKQKRRLRLPEGELECIRKYLKWNKRAKNKEVSEDLAKNILELAKLAYSQSGQNTRLIREIFPTIRQGKEERLSFPKELAKPVTDKYISDLFHIPERNEMQIHIRQAMTELEKLEEEDECPEYIKNRIFEYSKGHVTVESVGEAEAWLEKFDAEGRRRRLMVKRSDLLPMILYVAQQRYLEQMAEKHQEYCQSEAKKLFLTMANAVMIGCNMPEISEKYRYDRLLLDCYQEEEMYGYGDIPEMILG